MPYTKTDKTYTHEHKSYVVYKGGSNGNTRFIRLNRKFTSVPSLQQVQKKIGGGFPVNVEAIEYYTNNLRLITGLTTKLKELKTSLKSYTGNNDFKFTFCEPQSGSFSLDDIALPKMNACKTNTIFGRRWVQDLNTFLNEYSLENKKLITYTKYTAFWKALEDLST